MKYITAAVVLAVSCSALGGTVSEKKWLAGKGDHGYYAVTSSIQSPKETSFGVYFFPSYECDAMLTVMSDTGKEIGSSDAKSHSFTKGEFQLQIDKNDTWEVTTASVWTSNRYIYIGTRAAPGFAEDVLNQIKFGRRLDVYLNGKFSSFSLYGSNKTVSLARDACMSDLKEQSMQPESLIDVKDFI